MASVLSELPPEAYERLVSAFRDADVSGDGFIDRAELGAAVKRVFPALDNRAHDLTVRLLMKAADQDGDGKLDFAEFALAIKERQLQRRDAVDGVLFHVLSQEHPLHHVPASHIEKLLRSFAAADVNADEHLDPGEVVDVLARAFPGCDADVLEDVACVVVDTADRDGDGRISLHEFILAFAKEHEKLHGQGQGHQHQNGAEGPSGQPILELDAFLGAVDLGNALVHLPPAEAGLLLRSFVGDERRCSTPRIIRATPADVAQELCNYFHGIDAAVLSDIAAVVVDTSSSGGGGAGEQRTVDLAPLLAAVWHGRQLQQRDARRGVLEPTGSVAVLAHNLSTENSLFHLVPQQVETLLEAYTSAGALPPPPLPITGFHSAASIRDFLARMFPCADRSVLADVAEILFDTAPRAGGRDAGGVDLTRFIGSFTAQRFELQRAARSGGRNVLPYAVSSAVLQRWVEALTLDEAMILRDAFIRLDTDGDGFVTSDELGDAVAASMDSHDSFAAYLPYHTGVFAAADKNHDGRLDLIEFVESFIDGVGAVPQRVVVESVAKVRIRISAGEMLSVQETFNDMDTDADGLLNASELQLALKATLPERYPELSDAGFNELVAIVLEVADRDRDGRLNMSEFVRSLQEDQGVLPQQLIEGRARAAYRALSPQDAETVAKALAELCATTAEFLPYEAMAQELHDALEPRLDMHQPDIDHLIESVLLSTDRDSEGRVSVRAFVRSFSLGQHRHPDDPPHRPPPHVPNVMNADELRGRLDTSIDGARPNIVALTPSKRRHHHGGEGGGEGDSTHGAEELGAEDGKWEEKEGGDADETKGVCEVLLVDEALRLYRKVFRYFDSDGDGLLRVPDVDATLVQQLRRRHPGWPERTLLAVAESLFCAADVDEDGALTEQEFIDSFTSGYGIFPDEFMSAMRLRLVVALTQTELANLRSAFNAIDANHDGYLSRSEIEHVLARLLCPEFELTTIAALAQTILAEADENADGRISMREFVATFQRDQQVMALPVLAVTDAPQHQHESQAGEQPGRSGRSSGSGREAPTGDARGGSMQAPPLSQRSAAGLDASAASYEQLLRRAEVNSGISAAMDTQREQPEGELPPLSPYEVTQLREIFDTIDKRRDGFVDECELRLVLEEAIAGLFGGDAEKVERVVSSVMSLVDTDHDGRITLGDFVTSYSSNPEILRLPILAARERLERTEAALESMLLEEDLRQIAKVFVHLDRDKDGVLNFTELRDTIFSLLQRSHPDWCDTEIERVVRQLYDAADVNQDGVLTLGEFILSFAQKHYVLPPSFVAAEANALRRRLTSDELAELRVLFHQIDEDNDGQLSAAELEATLRDALANTVSGDTASINAIIAGVLAVVDTNRDGLVSFHEFVGAYERDTTVLDIPIMAAAQRREMAERQLHLLLSERDLRSLTRVFLHLDVNGDGLLRPADLHDAMFQQLSVAHPDWDAARIEDAIDCLITSADVNEDGMLSLNEFIGSFVEGHYVLPPSYIREVCAALSEPLTNDEVLRLRAAFEEMDCERRGFVTEVELRAVVAKAVDDKAMLDAIVNAIVITTDSDDDGRLTITDFLRAYQLDGGLLRIPLNALSERIAARVAARVLSADALRDIARYFTFLDAKRDAMLDEEEIRDALLAELADVHRGLSHETLQLLARQCFRRADLDGDGLLSLEEFVASFAHHEPTPLLFRMSTVIDALQAATPNRTPRTPRADAVSVASRRGSAPIVVVAVAPAHTPPTAVAGAATPSPRGTTSDRSPCEASQGTASPSGVSVGVPRAAGSASSAASALRSQHQRALPHDVSNVAIFDDELRVEFSRYDREGNGAIDKREFMRAYAAMEFFGLPPSRAEVERLFAPLGDDRGFLGFDEFAMLMLHRARM